MYDYILPVSNKDIVNIAKRAFNLVDPRLMGHGERVANIMFQIMEAEGGYTPVQMRNLLTLAVLHDIGAYKTEEIDHMVEFETKHVWNHSIYGYLFLNYFSLFKELSRVVLFHHSSWKQLERMDDVPGHVKKAAQLLQLADRLDIYFENPKNRMGRESFSATWNGKGAKSSPLRSSICCWIHPWSLLPAITQGFSRSLTG